MSVNPEPTLDLARDIIGFLEDNWTATDYTYARDDVDLVHGGERRNEDTSRRSQDSGLRNADKVVVTYVGTSREIRPIFNFDIVSDVELDIKAKGGGRGGGVRKGEGGAVDWETLKKVVYRAILQERSYPLKDDTCNYLYTHLNIVDGTDTPESLEVRDYWRHEATVQLYGREQF